MEKSSGKKGGAVLEVFHKANQKTFKSLKMSKASPTNSH